MLVYLCILPHEIPLPVTGNERVLDELEASSFNAEGRRHVSSFSHNCICAAGALIGLLSARNPHYAQTHRESRTVTHERFSSNPSSLERSSPSALQVKNTSCSPCFKQLWRRAIGEETYRFPLFMFPCMPQFALAALRGGGTCIVCSLNTHMDLDERGSQTQARAAADIMCIEGIT